MRLAIGFLLSLGIIVPVWADDVANCAQELDHDRAIEACTSRIQHIYRLQEGLITGLVANSYLGDQALGRAFNHRGNAYLRKGNYSTALSDYNKAIAIIPGEPVYYYNRALAFVNLLSYGPAVGDLTQAVALNRNFAQAYNVRAFVHLKASNAAIALEDANVAVRLSPETPDHLRTRGQVLAKLGRVEEAVVDLRKALSLDPTISDVKEHITKLGFRP